MALLKCLVLNNDFIKYSENKQYLQHYFGHFTNKFIKITFYYEVLGFLK